MPADHTPPKPSASETGAAGTTDTAARRHLTPEAERALAEAAARRAERDRAGTEPPKEIQGRDGPEPTRYGDWEVNGLASDF